LTLDADLQRIAERAVAPHPAAAVAVVDVATGKVLALVSKPSFDPNVMTGHLTKAEAKFLLRTIRASRSSTRRCGHRTPRARRSSSSPTIAALEDGQAARTSHLLQGQLPGRRRPQPVRLHLVARQARAWSARSSTRATSTSGRWPSGSASIAWPRSPTPTASARRTGLGLNGDARAASRPAPGTSSAAAS
jgi:hypothetical protein